MTDSAAPSEQPSEDTEYNRFAELAKRLIGVPKKELDEARKRERLAKS